VTWKTPGSGYAELHDHGGEVVGKGRAPFLVVDETQGRPSPARRRTVLTTLVP